MRPVQSLILLANEGEARLLKNEGVGKGLRQIVHLDRDEVSGKAIAYADVPGRSRSGPGATHHGMDRSSSETRQNRERFAADLVVKLHATWATGDFERLYIAAPPKMLGALRERLPKALAGRVTGDIAKDLLHISQDELPGHFDVLAAF